MNSKRIAIITMTTYISIMVIGIYITSNILPYNYNDFEISISLLMTQFIATLIIIYVVNKFYGWENAGFKKIEFNNLIWFLPYIFLIVDMLYHFSQNIYLKYISFNSYTWITLIIIFIGTLLVGFSEEVIFRGILLNSLKSEGSILKAMTLSSVGFSIIHIVNIFSGMSLLEVCIQIIEAILLGFSFASLAIKLNNIWPIIIFHAIWNFIIISSNVIGSKVPNISILCTPLNIIIGAILWISIIKYEKNNIKASEDLVTKNI
ncbi:type II CAAX endopeptidase family protein [Romboutsia sp.]|uniref:CPBP family intramembrane glutamic endopeptidase n=1 Tax=Romboutsia sp. TaxID=1965302 RepID=UPI002CF24394|nr:type II CAAX endopeptidase family protein [Romboutsia sp.]HSQ90417.1 type II CAAX endopeptidase family protein [Romboutsia sp.]